MEPMVSLIKNIGSDYVFNLQEVDSSTWAAGIYFVIDKDNNIIYVGQSVDIRQRISQHRWDKFRNGERFLWKERDRNAFGSKLEEEAYWISILQPVYNRTIKTKINPRKLMEYEKEKGACKNKHLT